MTWRLAKSLETLRAQVNLRWPTRNKSSDGSIGDPAHSARTSDHNPNDDGVVCAIDITHDPKSGCDSEALAQALRASRDPRIKYIISNRKICSPDNQNWAWRKYTGSNPHDHHVHISVKGSKAHYDNVGPWVLDVSFMPPPIPTAPEPPPTLKQGDNNDDVKRAQKLLGVVADGSFGPLTLKAVKAFQSKHGLVPDGYIGPQTWHHLNESKKHD